MYTNFAALLQQIYTFGNYGIGCRGNATTTIRVLKNSENQQKAGRRNIAIIIQHTNLKKKKKNTFSTL